MPTFSVLPPLSELSGAGVLFAALTGMCYAVHLLYRSLRKLKLERRLSGAVRSTAGALATGPVELAGTAVPAAALLDPIYNQPCAYYQVDINEAYVGAGKAGKGLLGRLNNRDRKHYYFGAPVSLFHADSGAVPLLLADGTGLAPVYPDGAGFLRKNTLDIFEKRQGDSFADSDPSVTQFLNKIPRRNGVHLRAVIIREGDPLHVWGRAGEAVIPLAASEEPGLQAEWLPAARAGFRGAVRKDPDGFFIISDEPKRKPASAFLPLRSFYLLFRGPLLFIFCFLYLLYRTNILGAVYASGWGPVPGNEAWAAALFKANCGSGDPYACARLSQITARSLAIAKAEARAAALFKAASASGRMESYRVAPLEDSETGPASDRIQIKSLSAEAAVALKPAGNSDRILVDGLNSALTLNRKGCEAGDAGNCLGLGFMYLSGTDVPKDEVQAAGLFKKACDGKTMAGCTTLATMYLFGQGVPKDMGRAAAALKLACSGGDPFGCGILGALYLDGLGVPRDHARAAGLYKQACDSKVWMGCTSLGGMYAAGTGVEKNEARAAALYKQACDAGNAKGCALLARLALPR